nr:class I SAM-dependent methyltransferase [Hyphomonas sediminis]
MRENIAVTGEGPEYFARYKIADTHERCKRVGLQPKQILDFGSGIGASTPLFAEFFPEAEQISADVSQKSLSFLGAKYPGLSKLVHISDDKLPLDDNSIDLAFTACVFHHIAPDEHHQWLTEIRRVLRPGGLFMLFEHNPFNPLTVRAVNTCPFDENAILIKSSTMAERLRRAGFEPPQTDYRIFFPSALAVMRPLEQAMKWLPLGGQYSLSART